jgi:hypothetical protein
MHASEEVTGTPDEHYNLISVLYHLLQGAETLEKYIDDAERKGDQELVQFFHEVQDEHCALTERAKRLLTRKIGRESEEQPAASE